MSKKIKIYITIKNEKSNPIDVDREIRNILRDNLELAVVDVMNDVVCDYRSERVMTQLQIVND